MRQMLQACRNKLLWILAGSFLCLGCHPKKVETLTLGEWLENIVEKAGLDFEYAEQPYFLNILPDSPYFKPVQVSYEYGIVSNSHALDPEEDLTREWCAYTLMNLSMKELSDTSVRDSSQSQFPKHISTAVSSGLMDTDRYGRFFPKRKMEKEEALELLEKVVLYINYPEFETTEHYQAREDLSPRQIEVQESDLERNSVLTTETDLQKGDLVSFLNEQGQEEVCTVKETEETKSGNRVQLEPVSPLEYLQDMDLSGETDLDFSRAEILEEEEEMTVSEGIGNVASHSKTIHGYTFTYTLSSNGINASVSRELEHGEKLYGELKLNGIHVKYRWHTEKKDLQNAYFAIQAHSQESLGVKTGLYTTLYGDFSKLSSEDFLSSLSQFLKPKSEMKEIDIPICTLRVPMESSNTLTIKARLSLRIYASGRAELTLTQDHLLGCDIRNGKVRWIQENTHDQNALLRADTSLSGNLRFSLDFIRASLMDVALEAGVRGNVNGTVHLYNEEGEKEEKSLEYPLDIVDDLSQNNGNVLCCGDMKAYWLLNVQLNSSSSLLGKLGFSKKLDIFNASNAPLFRTLNVHTENFQIVPKCTRTAHKKRKKTDSLDVEQQITLDSYNKVVHLGDSWYVQIKGLSAGYTSGDLCFTSKDEAIATVGSDGLVTGVKEGSTSILVKTSDGKYSKECNVLITKG